VTGRNDRSQSSEVSGQRPKKKEQENESEEEEDDELENEYGQELAGAPSCSSDLCPLISDC
jgi:hypothetical protein